MSPSMCWPTCSRQPSRAASYWRACWTTIRRLSIRCRPTAHTCDWYLILMSVSTSDVSAIIQLALENVSTVPISEVCFSDKPSLPTRSCLLKTLFEPIQIGDLTLPNRVIMAPLTRSPATEGRVPNAMMAEHYRQRASAGLILTEATSVTPMGVGYPNTPGIWSDEKVEGWKLTTKAVHDAGGRIFMQLWHVGRISD